MAANEIHVNDVGTTFQLTDGKAKYVIVADDLGTAGTWKIQGKVTFTTTIYHSDVHNFTVYKNL